MKPFSHLTSSEIRFTMLKYMLRKDIPSKKIHFLKSNLRFLKLNLRSLNTSEKDCSFNFTHQYSYLQRLLLAATHCIGEKDRPVLDVLNGRAPKTTLKVLDLIRTNYMGMITYSVLLLNLSET